MHQLNDHVSCLQADRRICVARYLLHTGVALRPPSTPSALNTLDITPQDRFHYYLYLRDTRSANGVGICIEAKGMMCKLWNGHEIYFLREESGLAA